MGFNALRFNKGARLRPTLASDTCDCTVARSRLIDTARARARDYSCDSDFTRYCPALHLLSLPLRISLSPIFVSVLPLPEIQPRI